MDNMNRYLLYKNGKKEDEVKVLLRIVGIFVFILNVVLNKYYKSIAMLPLIYLSFYKKEVYICEESIEFFHKALFLRYIDVITISEITDIIIKKKEEETVICIISGYKIKKIIIDGNDLNKVKTHLKKKNKNINFD